MMKNLYRLPLTNSGDTVRNLEPAVADLISGKIVMFAANYVSDGFKQVFCSWSNEGHLIQNLISTDPSSRELFTGYPMRKGFYDAALVKKLRREFEAHLQRAVVNNNPEYLGFELKRALTTAEHRRKQLVLCMSDSLLRDQKEPQPTGIRSFSLVLVLLFAGNLIILLVHLIFKIWKLLNYCGCRLFFTHLMIWLVFESNEKVWI